MRFLQSLVVPLLVAGTLAKTQLKVRDNETINSTDITAGVENAGNVKNVDTSDNLDNVDVSDNSENVDDVDKGGPRGGGSRGGGPTRGNGGGNRSPPKQPARQPPPRQGGNNGGNRGGNGGNRGGNNGGNRGPPRSGGGGGQHGQGGRPRQNAGSGGRPKNGGIPGGHKGAAGRPNNPPGWANGGGHGGRNNPGSGDWHRYGNGPRPGDRHPEWNGGRGGDWGRGGADWGWNDYGYDAGWVNGIVPEIIYAPAGFDYYNAPNYYDPYYTSIYVPEPTWDQPAYYPTVTVEGPAVTIAPGANCYAVETTAHTVTVTEASYTSTMTEAPDGIVTVYVDPVDSQTYTYGASTIFEVYIYTTTQNIDIVGQGQSCNGAQATPAPFAAWNPLASLGGLLGLSPPITATPYDPYAPENLPVAGGFDSASYAEPAAPLGADGLPIYPEYSESAIPFDAGPVPAPAPTDAGLPVPVPAAAPSDAGLPAPTAAPAPADAAAALPFKRAVMVPRTLVARRRPAAVKARATPIA